MTTPTTLTLLAQINATRDRDQAHRLGAQLKAAGGVR